MDEQATTLRIGEVAQQTGTTPRTIRYYEQLGLLAEPAGREKGRHRTYTAADVERIEELLRLRGVLGVSLEELKELVEREDARAALREEFRATDDPVARRRILHELRGHVERQLEVVAGRRRALDELEADLHERRARIEQRLSEL